MESRRLETIDALRGLAALAVFAFHLTHGTPLAPRGRITAITAYGWLGVEVFFVISGFIIPYALYRSGYRIGQYGRFVLKRMARLDPPYLVSILLVLSVSYLLTWAPHYQGEPFHFDASSVFAHLLYLNAVLGYQWLSPVYWTLAIEFQYYLLVGLLFPLVVSAVRWKRLALLIALSTLALTPVTASLGFSFAPLFCMGFMILQHRIGLVPAREAILSLVWFAVACGCSLGLPHALAGLAAALAIAFVDFRSRITSFLGMISYSLYLVHPPVTRAVLTLGRSRVATDGERALLVTVTFAITVLAAWVFYVAVERPAHRWSSALDAPGTSRPEPLPAAKAST